MRDATDQARLIRYARGGHLDGVILLSLHGADPLPSLLQSAGIPVVLGGRPLRPVPDLTTIDVDNDMGARLAVEHLISCGRRRIAHLAGAQDMCAGIDRLAGYRRAVESAGLAPTFVAHADFGEPTATRATEELLRHAPQLDALYAASDIMAAAAMAVLRAAGRRVPDDVAVIGNDDLDIAKHTVPPLTTVRQPVDQVAAALVAALAARITGRDGPETAVFAPELVIRGSS